jgi:transcriptional regulator with XRE-family HTH domain
MAKKTAPLLPVTEVLLRNLGERLRMARLRRRLPAKQVAERAGMAPMTLRSLERGASGVTIGAYAAVMQVLGIENELDLLAQVDATGRALQDAPLLSSGRGGVSRRRPARGALDDKSRVSDGDAEGHSKASNKGEGRAGSGGWVDAEGFADASVLSDLIVPGKRRK